MNDVVFKHIKNKLENLIEKIEEKKKLSAQNFNEKNNKKISENNRILLNDFIKVIDKSIKAIKEKK